MDSPTTQLVLVSLLLFSLYVTDAWILGNQPDSRADVLDGLLTTVFVIFCFEVVTLSLVEPNYIYSFFFYMDILGAYACVCVCVYVCLYVCMNEGLSCNLV